MYFRNSYCKTDKIGTTENEKKKEEQLLIPHTTMQYM